MQKLVYKVSVHSCVTAVCENNQPIMVKIHPHFFFIIPINHKQRLFVVAAMLEHELLKLRPLLKRGLGAPAHLHLKGKIQKQCVLAHTLKVATLTSYKKNDLWGIFELKLHIHTLGTSETYFTSCINGQNMSHLSGGKAP